MPISARGQLCVSSFAEVSEAYVRRLQRPVLGAMQEAFLCAAPRRSSRGRGSQLLQLGKHVVGEMLRRVAVADVRPHNLTASGLGGGS
jgi:hypothetical protein